MTGLTFPNSNFLQPKCFCISEERSQGAPHAPHSVLLEEDISSGGTNGRLNPLSSGEIHPSIDTLEVIIRGEMYQELLSLALPADGAGASVRAAAHA